MSVIEEDIQLLHRVVSNPESQEDRPDWYRVMLALHRLAPEQSDAAEAVLRDILKLAPGQNIRLHPEGHRPNVMSAGDMMRAYAMQTLVRWRRLHGAVITEIEVIEAGTQSDVLKEVARTCLAYPLVIADRPG